MENETAAPTLKESCIMGSTWTWAAFQSVVIRCLTCSDSRQHMVLYLSLERHTLDPRTSASAVNEAEQGLCERHTNFRAHCCKLLNDKNKKSGYVLCGFESTNTLAGTQSCIFSPVPISCRAYRSKRWLENERMSFDCFTTAKWNRPLFTRHRRTTHIGVALSSPNRLIYHSPCCSHFNARRNPPRPFDREERSGRDRKENPLI